MQLNSDLIIETTRHCNMTCEHCLRGNPQRKKISRQYLISTLRQFDYINSITFTGGEPSLNPEAIEDFLHICRMNNIQAGNFYIVTNAKRSPQRFLDAVSDLHSFCSENEMSQLVISNDSYHYGSSQNAIDKLFRLFEYQQNECGKDITSYRDKNNSYINDNMINQGRCDYGKENKPESFEYLDREYLEDNGTVQEVKLYLNCD